MTHSVRMALRDDYNAIAAFLHEHWRPDHIFCQRRDLFDWQHWNEAEQRYNLALGCAADGAIHGVFGFIPNGQFDPKLGTDAVWLAIWKVSDAARGHGLGRRLLGFIEETCKPTFIGTNGATEMTLPMYEARGYRTGRMEHWYTTPGLATVGRGGYVSAPYPLPKKTETYVKNRYAQHPFYRYDTIGNERTAVVLRLCENAERNVRMLRVVDVLGSSAGLSHLPWRQIAEHYKVRIIDLYCAGIPMGDLAAAGFKRRRGDEVIIPNHFEPYEHRNVEIDYAFKAPRHLPWRICKGDSDMDRPNILPAIAEAA